jgi:SP family xylose:H+ symportor-like MFS transporter
MWAANFLISSTYPAMMEISSGGTYCLYGVMSVLSFIFVWKMVPETKNKTLEEMESLWKNYRNNSM